VASDSWQRPEVCPARRWWQTALWHFAVYAVVIYSRVAAERLADPVAEIARRIAARYGLELTA
jgi:hypothetical protein